MTDIYLDIFSSKSEAGSKYFYWIIPFNDMQQMWNEKKARGNTLLIVPVPIWNDWATS